MSVVKVSYFSDALCIWAYIAQARIDAVKEKFAKRALAATVTRTAALCAAPGTYVLQK